MFQVPRRVAKEILSPGSLIQNHYHGKCFNLQLYSAANIRKTSQCSLHVTRSVRVDSDIRLEAFPSIFLHLYLSIQCFALLLFCGHKMTAPCLALHLNSKQQQSGKGQKVCAS